VDAQRVKRLARLIAADILSVGSALSAGPVWSAGQEAELLDAVEIRLHALRPTHEQETDAEIAARFRREHPDLYEAPRRPE